MNDTATGTNDAFVLRTDRADGLTTLTLNRPAQFNPLSTALMTEFQRHLDALAGDAAVRVVVIAGAGKVFCAGHDLREMRSHPEQGFQQALFRQAARLMTALTQLPQPVIARVHGVAAAGGCQLVSMCDLAVAADLARFSVPGINVGLFCSTPAVGLSRNVGRKQAFEMLVSGEFIDALEAQRRGLVNRVVPLDALDAEVDRLAAAILAKSPAAVALGKRLFYRQAEMGLEAAYQLAAETMACNMMLDDAGEGIDAFIARRKPHWKGR